MKRLFVILIFFAGFFAAGPGSADSNDQQVKGRYILSMVEESAPSMLSKCCWAEGRSAFHYCSEYGICSRDPKETCVGVGAAEGLQLSCSSSRPDKEASSTL